MSEYRSRSTPLCRFISSWGPPAPISNRGLKALRSLLNRELLSPSYEGEPVSGLWLASFLSTRKVRASSKCDLRTKT